MIEVTQELRGEISGLQWLDARQLKERYADLLADGMRCERIEFLRSVIAFRLPERFYGTRVSEASMKLIQHAVEGDLFKSAPADKKKESVTQLTRNWHGVDYVVTVYADDKVEYNGKMYKSLTAVAKAITGTHWNGPIFFGVKK